MLASQEELIGSKDSKLFDITALSSGSNAFTMFSISFFPFSIKK